MIIFEPAQPNEAKPSGAKPVSFGSGLDSFPEYSSYGKAVARYADSISAVYGDADYGYLIIQAELGKHRFVSFRFGLFEISEPFNTLGVATVEAYLDCVKADLSDQPWASELLQYGTDLIVKQLNDLPH